MKEYNRYRPVYHASVPEGWSNDPNGLIYYKGKVHMYFQYYPYKAEWGQMHWGHFVTEDFIHWEIRPTALVPDRDYEEGFGCFSGSAVEMDGKLWLMYTAARPAVQSQCLAYSQDADHFEKIAENPVLTADMLNGDIRPEAFRDPKILKRDGFYYCLVGARMTGEGCQKDKEEKPAYGNIVLCKSKDLFSWEYCGRLLKPQPGIDEAFFRVDGVYECPDYFVCDGTEVLFASVQNLPRMGMHFQNAFSPVYMTGHLDFETGHFAIESIDDLDSGFDFYAAQVVHVPDGRHIMLAWKEMWHRTYPTVKDNWIGTYSLPRELTFREGHLIQKPVREIEACRRSPVSAGPIILNDTVITVQGIEGKTIEIDLLFGGGNADRFGVSLFKGRTHETLVYYDRKMKAVVFDRTRAGQPVDEENDTVRCCPVGEKKELALRIFLDVSCVEVFIDGGRYVMSGNVYPDPDDTGVAFFAVGGTAALRSVRKYEINV